MSLSDTEKAKIRSYIGFSAFMPNMQTRLESALNLIGNYPGDETLVKAWILQIDDCETKIIVAGSISMADESDEVTVNGPQQIKMLVYIGRQYISRIAVKLGFKKVGCDYFGTLGIDTNPMFQVDSFHV